MLYLFKYNSSLAFLSVSTTKIDAAYRRSFVHFGKANGLTPQEAAMLFVHENIAAVDDFEAYQSAAKKWVDSGKFREDVLQRAKSKYALHLFESKRLK